MRRQRPQQERTAWLRRQQMIRHDDSSTLSFQFVNARNLSSIVSAAAIGMAHGMCSRQRQIASRAHSTDSTLLSNRTINLSPVSEFIKATTFRRRTDIRSQPHPCFGMARSLNQGSLHLQQKPHPPPDSCPLVAACDAAGGGVGLLFFVDFFSIIIPN